MILEKQSNSYKDYTSDSFVSTSNLIKLLSNKEVFKTDLMRIFKLKENIIEVFKIGNAKFLIDSIVYLDLQCEKIDIEKEIKNIFLEKMFEEEKAIFAIFNISNDFIIKNNKSDMLFVETKYSAKSDLLEYYNFSKFANYCRDNEYNDLVDFIKDYLLKKNSENNEKRNLRILYKFEDSKYYLRAVTSTQGYKDFGINFSVFVALVSLGRYVEKSNNEIFIDNYCVNDSEIYVSFCLKNEIKIKNDLTLSISLILENDEIKRNSVSFNGVCKLSYLNNHKVCDIYIKPKGIKKVEQGYEVDLLTYPHKGSIEKVYEKIEELPTVIDLFIKQVSEDAPKISLIQNPDDVRRLIAHKIKNSKKQEFQAFKERIFEMLMKITVDNTFKLFELLSEVENLFEHTDVISRDFWRTKLYEALIDRK